MLIEQLEALGLSKNEAEIYVALLGHDSLTISTIATRSKVHRRNVYDCIARLMERGLVYEVHTALHALYSAHPPQKLEQLIEDQKLRLSSIMPELTRRHAVPTSAQVVALYRGIEGWKDYMRDILKTGADYYCIGGKGGWMDPQLSTFFPSFYKELTRRKIRCRVLFDNEVKVGGHQIQRHVGRHYRFLPPHASSTAAVEIYGDRVGFVTNLEYGGFRKDFSMTIIRDTQLANGFRHWFEVLWSSGEVEVPCKDEKRS